jgi:colanic acid/amylovoran biosynthesis glycosyltransferase
LRYYNESRKQGYSLLNAIKSCYLQAHILLEQPDWLHYEFATLAIGREHLAKALGAKMSVSIRGFDIAIYPLKHPNCYLNLWKYIDKLHTISDDLLTIALKEGLLPNTQVEKITPAIDTTKFTIKADAGSFHPTIQLITVARLHWKKGLNYQLQAALKLKAQLIKFTWHIVGDGVDKEQLLFLIKLYNLEQEVILHGKKTHAEVLDLYKSCDIYVQYSVQEGFCNAVLEAQACGLITIVSDAEGLSENVLHQVTGYVLPKRNPSLLAQQIIKVLQSQPEELKNMATRASDRVRQEFDLEKQSKKFIAFYQS